MCGIIGAISYRNIVPTLVAGLKRLEYRGYDSAGLIVINHQDLFHLVRQVGKVKQLENVLKEKKITGNVGLAHTRWATHGKPTLKNTHPHVANNEIAIVHNGIIENQQHLRELVLAKGCKLKSETDSEIIAHLIYLNIKSGQNFLTAVKNAVKKLQGAFALGIIRRSEPHHIFALRCSSPLVIGIGDQENFIASDQTALLPITQRIMYLEEGDIADISAKNIIIYNAHGKIVQRKIHISNQEQNFTTKNKFSHYMLKEIFEQPDAVAATLEGRWTKKHILSEAFGEHAADIFKKIKRIQIVGCGTSFHGSLIGKYWLEAIAQLPCQADIASEYRFYPHIVEPNTLFVTLSQSGETADTIAALRLAKKLGYAATLTICNVAESTLVRESDLVLMTNAGPEIGVASTKAFTTQLTGLILLSLSMGSKNSKLKNELLNQLTFLPQKIRAALEINPLIKKIAQTLVNKNDVLFIGRDIQFPIAMEGALKFKEVTYIHADAYPAGEFKHGPIALIDKNTYVIALVPTDKLLKKMKSNLHEILAREGKLIVFCDNKSEIENNKQTKLISMPVISPLLSPIIYTIPMQLLAYHVAVLKGNDVDQPRNLAKSVTVE